MTLSLLSLDSSNTLGVSCSMPISDLPLAELETFAPEIHLPADFDEFWRSTLAGSRAKWQPPKLVKIDGEITEFDVFDITFSGFDGEPIKAWFIMEIFRYNDHEGGAGHHWRNQVNWLRSL